jgi:hypothetical protein
MPKAEVLGCAVCTCTVCCAPTSSVGMLYDGTKVARILACQNGHFIPAMTPEEHTTWLNLAALGKFFMKLQVSDLLPNDLQELWIRKNDIWRRASTPDAAADAVNLGLINPCPFCRSTNTFVMRDTKHYFLCCDSCDVFGPEAAELSNAIIKWNAAWERSCNGTC